MADFPTFDDLFDAGEREILIRPTSFSPEIVRTDGSDVNIAMAWSAAMAEEVARAGQLAFNETHLALAIKEGGETLDRWVLDRYQEPRQESQASVVTLELRRTDTTEGVTVEAGSLFGAGDVVFATVNDVVFPVGSTGPLFVIAIAQKTGPTGDVPIGAITDVVSQLEDATITVTNLEPSAGGTEAESDDAYGARAQDFFINARRGTLAAIISGATSTPGVTEASATENIEPATGLPNFRVSVVIADDNGQANAALAQRVRERQDEFRCLGVPVTVLAGVPEFVDIVVEGLTFKANTNTTTVLEQARASILGAVNGTAPSETLTRNVIETALGSVDNLIVPAGAVVQPAGDLVPLPGGVIRTTKSRIRLNGT